MDDIIIPQHMKSYMEAYNKYFTLKKTYENALYNKRKTIRKSQQLTMEEKILKLKNVSVSCVMCGGKGGSKFYRKNRILYAKCSCETPCAFSMEIELSQNYDLPSAIEIYGDKLYEYKKNIVVTKLNYLFDLEKNDITSQRFNVLKEDFVTLDKQVSMLKVLLKQQLELIETTDNDGSISNSYRSDVLKEKINILHSHLKDIKKVCINHKKDPDKFKIKNAVTIYLTNVVPLVDEIRKIKYNQVYMDNFELKQIKHNIENYNWADPDTPGNVIENNFQKIKKKKKIRKKKKKAQENEAQENEAQEKGVRGKIPQENEEKGVRGKIPQEKEIDLEVDELEEPPIDVSKEEIKPQNDEDVDQENVFEPDEEPNEEKNESLPEKKDIDANQSIEQQDVVNIEDIGELEEFKPEIDT